jgi:tRNA(Ile)-lysidine synthase
MRPRSGRLIRPFLGLRRAQTLAICAEHGLTPWHDPANDNPHFTRSRLRQAMPLLEETLGPGLTEALARTGSLCSDDADYVDAQATELLVQATSQPAGPKMATSGEPRAMASAQAMSGTQALGHPGQPSQISVKTHDHASLAVVPLAQAHPALRRRALLLWLRECGSDNLTAVHIRAVDALVTNWHGQKPIDVPGGKVARQQGWLQFVAHAS